METTISTVKYLVQTIKWILVAIVTVMIGCYIAGLRPYILTSASMEPRYSKGSLVLLNSKADVADAQVGDTVGVVIGRDNVFHRILSISDDEERITAADENNAAIKTAKIYGDYDGQEDWTEVELSKRTFLGPDVISIPGIGSLITSIRKNNWMIWGLPAALIVIALIPWEKLFFRSSEALAVVETDPAAVDTSASEGSEGSTLE